MFGFITSLFRQSDAESASEPLGFEPTVIRTSSFVPVNAYKQNMILSLADEAMGEGITWKDLLRQYPNEFGMDGAKLLLRKMHKRGIFVRLAIPRERCKVYVIPEYAGNRVLEAPGIEKRCAMCNSKIG